MPQLRSRSLTLGVGMSKHTSWVRVGTVTASQGIYSKISLAGALVTPLLTFAPFVLVRFELIGGEGRDLFVVLLPGLLLLIPLHEGIHWLTARLSGAPGDKCGFGFARGFPYFRAHIPLPIRRYRAVLLAPGAALTLVTTLLAIVQDNFAWAVLAGLSLASGIGDYYWFWRLRDVAAEHWVLDPPGLVGVELLTPAITADPSEE